MLGAKVVELRPGAVQEPWVTKRACADHFSISEKTLERWVHAGCPVRKWDPRVRSSPVRFRISVVEAWRAGVAVGMRGVA